VSMNAFSITAYPTKNVYQYDVSDLELPNDWLMSYAETPSGSHWLWCREGYCHQEGLELQC
jgi:hypothetical protein